MRLAASRFARDSFLLTGVTAVERVAALLQTILIARALGIVEYGIYGLLFTSIGFVASIAGLQMGLTATVLVARYRDTEKAKAAAVIGNVTRFALLVALAFWVLSLPFAGELSAWLLRSPDYATAILLGCVFIGASLLSGVQDGIAQGFEDFRAVAVSRFVAAAVTLAAMYPAALAAGLNGVIAAILAGVLLKAILLQRVIRAHRVALSIPRRGSGVPFRGMVLGFSLPSMLASMILGGVIWWGSFLLSRLPSGFESVALVNTGLQWRGPVLMLAASLGSVAVPIFSRLAGQGGGQDAERFRRRMLWLNGVAAVLVSVMIIVLSGPLLGLYGSEFRGGSLIFAILVATTVPMVLANVHMQELVGAGLMWRQLALHVPMVLVMGLGFALLIPRMAGLGYAIATAVASVVFVACAWLGRPVRGSFRDFSGDPG
ncbi:MAG: oligosaccharide flippase family protein [Pseudomonadota bacterium]|nr:oligosaccharide flippase family protein [Pseudomonadota bacterium]